jgi:hypothetical protein
MLHAHRLLENRISTSMFGTQVGVVDDALLQMIPTAWQVLLGLMLADTARLDMLVTVPVFVVDAFGAVFDTNWFAACATPGVMVGTETLLTVDTVSTVPEAHRLTACIAGFPVGVANEVTAVVAFR